MNVSFYFQSPDAPGIHDPLALGVAPQHQIAQAREDALQRLAQRPLPANDPAYAKLLTALRNGTAWAKQVPGDHNVPTAPTEYLNLTTQHVAEALRSDGDFISAMGKVLKDQNWAGDLMVLAQLVRRNAPRVLVRTSARDLGDQMIDWYEIGHDLADSLKDEIATPRPDPRMAAPAIVVDRSAGAEGEAPADADDTIIPTTVIPPDVLEVLQRGRTDETAFFLPAGQLDRKLYERVNQVLTSIGGKWKTARKAHIFPDMEHIQSLELALGTGAYIDPKDLGFFPTPEAVVRRALNLADLRPGQRMLEPEAGRGNFAVPMLQIAGNPDLVTVCEMLPSNLKHLRSLGFTQVVEGDFLRQEPAPIFDRIVMNPPFERGADIAHIQHASRFLAPGGTLTAISAPSWTFNSTRKFAEFRDLMAACDAFVDDIETGAFKSSGTDIRTKLIHFEGDKLPWNINRPAATEAPQG